MESGFGLSEETGGTKACAGMSTRSYCMHVDLVFLVMGNWVCLRHESYHRWCNGCWSMLVSREKQMEGVLEYDNVSVDTAGSIQKQGWNLLARVMI